MADRVFAYVGNLPGVLRTGGIPGIYGFRVDLERGDLHPVGVEEIPEPSHLAVSREGILYAATHTPTFRGMPGCGAVAYAIDRQTGRLAELNSLVLSATHACYVSLDDLERTVLVAAGMGGSVFALRATDDGALDSCSSVARMGERPLVPLGGTWESIEQALPRESDSTPHCIRVTPSNRFALVCDLFADRVAAFRFDSDRGALTRHERGDVALLSARHLAFHPGGRTAYVCQERAGSVTVLALDDEHGRLVPVQTRSVLPSDFAGHNETADIHVHPSGRWLYVSNRGHDSLAIFHLDTATGALGDVVWHPTGGRTPRGFAIAPGGELILVANQDSSTLDAHSIASDGRLEHVAQLPVPAPACVVVWKAPSQ